jgi:4-alpha-glucanotransferase
MASTTPSTKSSTKKSTNAATIHPLLAARRAGVLLHVTSLPGGFGIGDLGPESVRFMDWMQAAGLSIWQTLPVGPIGPGDSPYSSPSSFAGEPLLVSPERLAEDGLLTSRDLSAARRALSRTGPVRFAQVRRGKTALLEVAHGNFLAQGARSRTLVRDHARFLDEASWWLPGWTSFAASRDGRSDAFHAFCQWCFDRQWRRLRQEASARGIVLFGDVPIFTALDSADVHAAPELFRLDRQGRPEVVTGVPPDSFSKDGQLWGTPHYRWSAHRRDGFLWWRQRIGRALDRFDLVRIDHFIGFVRAYEVPARARNARRGAWCGQPGREVLAALAKEHPDGLPLVAEDLGAVTPPVLRLRDEFALPGMRILQNGFWRDDAFDMPHRFPPNCVVYPGTHDNHVATGWWRTLSRDARRRFLAYAGPASDPAEALVRLSMTSPANLAICQMQDLLALAPSTRMNLPGTPSGNWRWRLEAGAADAASARRLRAVIAASGRVPSSISGA